MVDLVVELAAKAAGLRQSMPPDIVAALTALVRSMNCYYSNLIEGHRTHPVDIERALAGNYSKDSKSRNLQLEAKAHVSVQAWIDAGGLDGRVLTIQGIREVHRRFCESPPDDLLHMTASEGRASVSVVPGAF